MTVPGVGGQPFKYTPNPMTPANPQGAGAHCKLTPELIEEACKVLALGNYTKTTCGYIGISEGTWANWTHAAREAQAKQDKGKKLTPQEELYIEFFTRTRHAQELAVVKNMKLINDAATTQWQAAGWLLERRYPEQFSLVQRIQVTPMPQQLSPDDIKRHLEERRKTIEIDAVVLDG